MVEWSKTWVLSYINFPITQVARVRTPLLSSSFFSHLVSVNDGSKKHELPTCLYRKQMRERGWYKQIQNKTRVMMKSLREL